MAQRTEWRKVIDPRWACKQGICAHPECLARRAAKLARERRQMEKLLGVQPESGEKPHE